MESIYDILRRYEFNKTEAETLQGLVKKAAEKGTAAQQEMKNLARAAQVLASKALDLNLISARSFPTAQHSIPPIAGIDGSSQQVGGFGGKWYVPISCAIVKALHGTIADMEVEVAANIEEIQQQEFQDIGNDVSKLMMTVETKAINTWAMKAPKHSYIFLDGPIIDPPTERTIEYVNLRCAAFKAGLAKNIGLVDCVKRSYDKAFLNYAKKALRGETKLSSLLDLFPSDSHLLVFVLSSLAKSMPSTSFLHTEIMPIEENEISKIYLEHGIRIFFAYLQRDIGTSLLRVEVIIPPVIKEGEISKFVCNVLDLCVATTYPGHYVPLPVQMAHEKCNIRQGCAEVLFDEIMTRARASEPIEQIVLSKLR